jgi:hypothetical protein
LSFLKTAGEVRLTSRFADRNVAYGETVYLRATASGALQLQFQWRFNGVDLPGATNAVLALNRVGFDQSGEYSVVVSNPVGMSVSSEFDLRVMPLLSSVQPQDQSTFLGGTVVFEASAAGQEPISYQWQFNGTNLAGETAATLAVTNAQLNQSGTYSLVATNALAGVRSVGANLSVGLVAAWGDNYWGQTNLPAGLADAVAVAGGGDHSLALKADGTVVAWGDNRSGQTDVPPGLANVVAVAAGNEHSLALKGDGTVVAWGGNYLGRPMSRLASATWWRLPPGNSIAWL